MSRDIDILFIMLFTSVITKLLYGAGRAVYALY